MISNMNKEYHIAEGVTAFSTTRKGGVSQGNYSEFNINDYCGDCAEHVAENRRKLADELGISIDHIILPHQVHGVEVRQVAGDYFSMPENIRKMILEGVDAVMTNEKGVCIGVSTADGSHPCRMARHAGTHRPQDHPGDGFRLSYGAKEAEGSDWSGNLAGAFRGRR